LKTFALTCSIFVQKSASSETKTTSRGFLSISVLIKSRFLILCELYKAHHVQSRETTDKTIATIDNIFAWFFIIIIFYFYKL
jgi:hypothetical protein